MNEVLLLERCRMESKLLDQFAAGWNNGAEAIPALELKQVVRLCKDLPAHFRQAQDALWDRIMAGLVDDFQKTGEEFLAALDEALGLLRKVAGQAQNGTLGAVLAELEQMRQEHQERWPWFTQKDLDEARAEAARGETLELTDAFAEIAGVSRERFLEMVKAHEQRKRDMGWE